MPSTPTTRLRVERQALGENLNTWGADRLNDALTRLEEAIADVVPITVSTANVTLTSTNYAADEARGAVLLLTGTLDANRTVTAPTVEKLYLVDDRTTRNGYSLTIKTAAGSGYALRPGPQWVFCDGTDFARGTPRLDQLPLPAAAVDFNGQKPTNLGTPTASSDAATKGYVDAQAFDAAAGNLPGQPGNGGKFLTTNGTLASWDDLPAATETSAGAAEIATQAETDAGTDDQRYVTPLKAASRYAPKVSATLITPTLNSPILNSPTSSAPLLTSAAEIAQASASTGSAYTLTNCHTSGTIAVLSHNANTTITLPDSSNRPNTSSTVFMLLVELTQDATGSRTVAFAAPSGESISWNGSASIPTYNQTANKTNLFAFYKRSGSTVWRGALAHRDA